MNIGGEVSHPQLPLLRVVVQSLAIAGALQLKEFQVKWQGIAYWRRCCPIGGEHHPRYSCHQHLLSADPAGRQSCERRTMSRMSFENLLLHQVGALRCL
ncbi:GPI-anchored surface protein, putative [Bodo saltans]|uniref:GPI-anchored surface protein, putative n=1 Tax=Bodo saltans TaxID=75058 RepID=A0A0S4J874_BODSA|nr:GPI-anchored surface protein, putative [Bodo saltans]|eukprot:CUG83066.1 GPI-anchored surface protein, putative [Bodo saltans]